MRITDDLKHAWLIHAKGALFIALGGLSATLLLAQMPTIKTAALLAITVWAFCRFYYYLFYVLERYLGQKRFPGVFAALRLLFERKGGNVPAWISVAAVLAALGARAADDYQLGPDSQFKPDVPHGRVE